MVASLIASRAHQLIPPPPSLFLPQTNTFCLNGVCSCKTGVQNPVTTAQPWPQQTAEKKGQQSVDTWNLGLPQNCNAGTCQCTLKYDSRNAPDRYVGKYRQGGEEETWTRCHGSMFLDLPFHPSPPPPFNPSVRSGSVCGPQIWDTGFTGASSSGCAASAPCCLPSDGPGCTGVAGQPCPPNQPGTQNGGGPGAGKVTL